MKPKREMRAGDFKAKCLSVLDEVAATKREIVITKRGRPVARIVPLEGAAEGPLDGLILEQQDLVAPLDLDWDAER